MRPLTTGGILGLAMVLASMTAGLPHAAAAEPLAFSDAVTQAGPASPQMVSDVTTADVDGDGLTDLLVSSSDGDSGATPSGRVSVYLTRAAGGLVRAGDVAAGARAYGLAVGDLDGDGLLDVVTTSYNGIDVLVGHGDGTFGSPAHVAGGNLREPVVADFNGDGLADVAAADFYHDSFLGAVDVFANKGDGTFGLSRVELGSQTFPTRLTAGDLNGDGHVDLVATNGAFHVILGHGDGTFAAPVRHNWTYTNYFGQQNFPAEIVDTTIGDFNDDGLPDLAAGSSNDTAAGLWFFPGADDGSLDFANAVSRRINDGAETINKADVDGDGLLDVVVGMGDGAYTPGVVNARASASSWPTLGYRPGGGYVSDTHPRSRVATLDVDGDGLLDLVTVDQVKRLIVVRTQAGPPPPPPTPPTISIDSPADGSSYEQDLQVLADYTCSDDAAVATCDGPVSSGSPVDTASTGGHTFEVDASDVDGNTASRTSHYDVTPAEAPATTITSPADGAHYTQDESVAADYVCDDGLGSGVDTCVGDLDVGDDVDTSTQGSHSFTVHAQDRAGHPASVTVTYEVVAAGADVDPPAIRIASPVEGATFSQDEAVTAAYECEDFGSGLDYCTGSVPDGDALDTSTGGEHTLLVEAADLAGNVSSREVSYFVDAGPPPADTTAPYVSFQTPQSFQRYATGGSYTVSYACLELGQSPSGVASCSGSVPNGSRLDTSTPGSKTLTVTATDNAGNSRTSSVQYQVIDDSDGDGLSDAWETQGVDIDHDGTVDLALDQAPYNADPNHRDVFVEMDYMSCQLPTATCPTGDLPTHAPQAGVVADVVKAFHDAPGLNPDGTTGITLHLDVDEAVPEIPVVHWYSSGGAYDDVDDIKSGPAGPCNGAFGTPAEKASVSCEKLLKAKAQVFRWGLFGHLYSESPGSSGIAEYPGNDFLVTVGGEADAWAKTAGSLGAAESGTVMHEMGHTFGLGHGGPGNDVNCKPNYLSVMNYSLQVPSLDPTRPLDYSRAALPTLEESALDESLGVQGPAGRNVVYGVGGQARVAPADGPIDWNGDRSIGGVVSGNPDDVGWCSSGGGETLTGADDWAALQYNFAVSPDYASGTHVTSTQLVDDEVTKDAALSDAQTTDFDGDGVPNATDSCPGVANAGQADLDGDGVGDACDSLNSVAITVTPQAGTKIKSTNKYVQVAVLSTSRFAAKSLQVASLRFGRTGTEATASSCSQRDVNGDKRSDLVCQFTLSRTGLPIGTTTAVLKGRTTTAVQVSGSTTVRITA